MKKNVLIIIAVIALLIVGGGSFYSGMLYGKGQAAALATSARASFAGRTGRPGNAVAGFTTGTIISKDSTSITLQLPSSTGGSKIIFYSNSTQINKTTTGNPTDLTNGTTVSVTGTTNSDGSITANSIQIRPTNTNPVGPNPSNVVQ